MEQKTKFWRWFYDRIAPIYDLVLELGSRSGIGSEKKIRAQVISAIKSPEHGLVIDVGCGTGSSRLAFGREFNYLGLDISRGMLRRAQAKCKRLGLTALWVQADAQALPLRRVCGDGAIAMGVIQHLSQPDKALSQVARATKPQAEVLLIDERRCLRGVARKLTGKAVTSNTEALARLEEWCTEKLSLEGEDYQTFGEYFIIRLARQFNTPRLSEQH